VGATLSFTHSMGSTMMETHAQHLPASATTQVEFAVESVMQNVRGTQCEGTTRGRAAGAESTWPPQTAREWRPVDPPPESRSYGHGIGSRLAFQPAKPRGCAGSGIHGKHIPREFPMAALPPGGDVSTMTSAPRGLTDDLETDPIVAALPRQSRARRRPAARSAVSSRSRTEAVRCWAALGRDRCRYRRS